jgi:hypothetical protein
VQPQIVGLAPTYQTFLVASVGQDNIETDQDDEASLAQNVQTELRNSDSNLNFRLISHSHAVQNAKIMKVLDVEEETFTPGELCTTIRTETTWLENLIYCGNPLVSELQIVIATLNKDWDREEDSPLGPRITVTENIESLAF